MEEVEVVYENGVFKPLKKVRLKEGTHGKVIIELGLADIIESFGEKVKRDVLKEFLEERNKIYCG
ncbi:hypothetical protein CL1_0983 [Thermococcus cleftensis]|uniref:Antitoxin n=1 Tax=Thermococcus cleftensis (strain DSM 27260 / KACC 17922 / CL1) TaxID=163003 RepID=I3ZU02_THECF|nr:antitoxin family protein [Thermococcus cleftensis]AFL95186.1 hypothetical protein CL1_0983 [Thermococcus cleftensis]